MKRNKDFWDSTPTRRGFLAAGVLGAAFVLCPDLAAAARRSGARALALYNTHTGERVRTTYWEQGEFVPEALSLIDHVLRDHRSGEVHRMAPGLLDLVWQLGRRLESREPFHVVSAYRSPETNDLLRASDPGVAKRSLHVTGEAVDLRLPGRSLRQVRDAAVALSGGGVGYYAQRFVHVDIGRVRRW